MNLFKRLTPAILALALLTNPALAFDDTDRTRLDATLTAYATALETSDFATVVNALPPKIIALIAEQAKLSPELIRQSVTAQMSSVMAQADIQSFTMDTDAMTSGTTEGGMNYAFLPTTTVISQGGNPPATVETLTLALDEDATWYLMRIERASHFDFIRAAYPDFQTIDLPE